MREQLNATGCRVREYRYRDGNYSVLLERSDGAEILVGGESFDLAVSNALELASHGWNPNLDMSVEAMCPTEGDEL